MDTKSRLEATKVMWGVLAAVLVSLFISAGVGNGLETGHVIIAVVALIAGAISTGVIWNPDHAQNNISSESKSQEKVKRERLDSVLRDLSDEELLALKNRLSDGTIDDDLLYEHMTLSDDGELISVDGKS